jgi:hypothetical protein
MAPFSPKKPREEAIFPVYAHKSALGCRPLFFVNKEVKLWMLAEGSAKSMARGKALQLLINILELRGVSCQMGPKVIERAVMGTSAQRELALTAAASYR